MFTRKRRERERSIDEHLSSLKKGDTNVLALIARQDCSLISEQRVQIK